MPVNCGVLQSWTTATSISCQQPLPPVHGAGAEIVFDFWVSGQQQRSEAKFSFDAPAATRVTWNAPHSGSGGANAGAHASLTIEGLNFGTEYVANVSIKAAFSCHLFLMRVDAGTSSRLQAGLVVSLVTLRHGHQLHLSAVFQMSTVGMTSTLDLCR